MRAQAKQQAKRKRSRLAQMAAELAADPPAAADAPKPRAGKKSDWDVRVLAWGSGSRGQLGNGSTRMQAEPCAANGVADPGAVAAGSTYSACLSEEGRLWCWGSSAAAGGKEAANSRVPRQLGRLARVRVAQIACGEDHTLVVTRRGRVLSWGSGANGRLGHGDELRCPAPRQVEALDAHSVTRVAVGETHSVVVTAQGRLFAFGGGVAGQLGLGDLLDRKTPQPVALTAGGHEEVHAVACGLNHTVVCTVSGAVFSWGWGEDGRLGLGDPDDTDLRSAPQRVGGGLEYEHVSDVACGGAHSLARTMEGRVFSWGWNAFGQLGRRVADSSASSCAVPTHVGGLPPAVTQMAAGFAHCAVLASTGELWAWGFGEEGQLGIGSEVNVFKPVKVRLTGNPHVVGIACGRVHTLALVSREAPEAREWRLATEARMRDASLVVLSALQRNVAQRRVARLREERRLAEAQAKRERREQAEAERLRLEAEAKERRLQELRDQAARELEEASERHRQQKLREEEEARAKAALEEAERQRLAAEEAERRAREDAQRRAMQEALEREDRERREAEEQAERHEFELRLLSVRQLAAAKRLARAWRAAQRRRAEAEARRARDEEEQRVRDEEERRRAEAERKRLELEAFQRRQRERDEARKQRARERAEREAEAERLRLLKLNRKPRRSSRDLLADREGREEARRAREEARRKRAEAVEEAEAEARRQEVEARAAARAAAAKARRRSEAELRRASLCSDAEEQVDTMSPAIVELSPRMLEPSPAEAEPDSNSNSNSEFDGLRPAPAAVRHVPKSPDQPPPSPRERRPVLIMGEPPKPPKKNVRHRSVDHWVRKAHRDGLAPEDGSSQALTLEEEEAEAEAKAEVQRQRLRKLSKKGQRVAASAAERRASFGLPPI